MKFILIDAKNRDVREVEMDPNADDHLEQLYKVLDVQMVEFAPTKRDDTSIVADEEGFINGTTHFFLVEGLAYQPIAGNGLIVSYRDEEGVIEPNISIESIRESVKFMDPYDVYLWSRKN